jgi:hypothetical protein
MATGGVVIGFYSATLVVGQFVLKAALSSEPLRELRVTFSPKIGPVDVRES